MMEQMYSEAFENPWQYEDGGVAPLIMVVFTVTDGATKYPLPGASCILYAGADATGDAAMAITDSQGKAIVDAQWFVPRSWSVAKEGYHTKISNQVGLEIHVELESAAVQYTVRIYSGGGGTTNPTGTLTRVPGTQLTVTAIPSTGYVFDYWTYKGQNVGSTNPMVFLIDRDAITILATFKEEVTPPPNGWPVVKTDHVFDNVRLDPGLLVEARKSAEKQVDTTLVLGGQIEYAVKLESSLVTACTYYIMWNNEILKEEGFWAWEPHGTIKSGVLDLPLSKIRSTNELTIALSQAPGTFNRCLFNVYVTLGYSAEPSVDPPWEGEDWMDWLMKNAWWIVLGGVIGGATIIYLAKPTGPPVKKKIVERRKK